MKRILDRMFENHKNKLKKYSNEHYVTRVRQAEP